MENIHLWIKSYMGGKGIKFLVFCQTYAIFLGHRYRRILFPGPIYNPIPLLVHKSFKGTGNGFCEDELNPVRQTLKDWSIPCSGTLSSRNVNRDGSIREEAYHFPLCLAKGRWQLEAEVVPWHWKRNWTSKVLCEGPLFFSYLVKTWRRK